MSRADAKRVLDAVRSGDADYSATFITVALIASGDLQPIERKVRAQWMRVNPQPTARRTVQ